MTTQRHGPNVATEMLPPSRADAGTRRHGDDEAATTTASLPLQPPRAFTIAAAFSCPQLAAAPCSPPASLQCPGPHKSCSPQAPLKPQVLTVAAAAFHHGFQVEVLGMGGEVGGEDNGEDSGEDSGEDRGGGG